MNQYYTAATQYLIIYFEYKLYI